jgi:hypothetical protein
MSSLIEVEDRSEPTSVLVAAASQREIAEIQGAITVAKRFPRDTKKAMDKILIACQRKSLAAVAVYQYAKGGTNIEGPSIRLAETIAREWGNLQFGVRELDQSNGESTVEAYCFDMENNVRCSKVFRIPHQRYTRSGSYALTDPREIYELVANNGARRLRACILGVIPGDVVDAAVEECNRTLETTQDVTAEGVKKMVDSFETTFKVTKDQLEQRLQRRIEAITPAQMAGLRKIFNSMRDGMSKPIDWFALPPSDASQDGKSKSEALADKLASKGKPSKDSKGLTDDEKEAILKAEATQT